MRICSARVPLSEIDLRSSETFVRLVLNAFFSTKREECVPANLILLPFLQIEFPSLLLPPSIQPGSIVDITVSLNTPAYLASVSAFNTLQDSILHTYGLRSPSPPILRCLNSTQTSVVLAWDELNLATAELRSLALYRNGQKAGVIPEVRARADGGGKTKVSGLALDTEYTFSLTLKTSAGIYHSERLTVRTHKMTDLSGIVVTPGVLPQQLRHSLDAAVQRIGARLMEGVSVETTHFVTTEGRGREWERAVEVNVPVVRPEWVEGCEREGRLVGVRGYYLNADPKLRQVGPGTMGTNANANANANARQSQTALQGAPGQQEPFQARPVPDRTTSAVNRTAAQQQHHDRPLSSHPPTELKSPTSGTEPPSPPAKDSPLRQQQQSQSQSQPQHQSNPYPDQAQEKVDDDDEDDDDDDGNEDGNGQSQSQSASRQPPSQQAHHRPRDLGISGAGGGPSGGGGDNHHHLDDSNSSIARKDDGDVEEEDGEEEVDEVEEEEVEEQEDEEPQSGGASFQEVEL